MKRFFLHAACLTLVLTGLLSRCTPAADKPVATAAAATGQTTQQANSRPAQVKAAVARDLTRLLALIDGELSPLSRCPAAQPLPVDSLRRVFRSCRLAYKRVEPFTEYFLPGTSRLVNGAPVAEVEVEETKMFEPAGLQVLELLLYPDPAPAAHDSAGRGELRRQTGRLRRQVRSLQLSWDDQEFTDAHVFDALRQQVFRVVTLGVTGFDTPLSRGATLPEAAAALGALEAPLKLYAPAATGPARNLRLQLAAARALLQQHPDFASFDRLAFVRDHANPLGRGLLTLQLLLGIAPFPGELRALRPEAATLFDAGIFNPDFYTANRQWFSNPAKVALGRQLFHDPVLSGGRGRSCASCHQPSRAFTDGLALSATLTGGTLRRNTPTILNAGLQAGQFYDLRVPNLENQAGDVIGNRDEMHGSLDQAAGQLAQQPRYAAQFRQAFPEAARTPGALVSPVRIQNALAAYERSLERLNSAFDRYARGEAGARLSSDAVRGFNLYAGRARCATCHFLPLTNGTVPPTFQESESEVLGVPVRPGSRRLDPDPGRYLLTKLAPLRYAFKTPTLRNVALTAPYMHNGQYQTLEQVIDFYNQGGAGLGLAVDNQTLPPDKLHLTLRDVADLKAFLLALTDTSGAR